MNSRAKFGAVALSAAAVLTTSLAFGAAGPDNTLSGIPINPTNRGSACFGSDCGSSWPYPYYPNIATESLECDSTGLGNPPPMDPDDDDDDSWSIGLIAEPFDSLGLTLDWYDFDIDDVILRRQPIDQFMIRGSRSETFRAPSIQELFFADDQRPGPAGTDMFSEIDAAIDAQSGRNYDVGYVIDPLDGLDVTLDYYDIEISDAIDVLGGGIESSDSRGTRIHGFGDPNKAGLNWQPQYQFKYLPTWNIGIGDFRGVGAQYVDIGAGENPIGGTLKDDWDSQSIYEYIAAQAGSDSDRSLLVLEGVITGSTGIDLPAPAGQTSTGSGQSGVTDFFLPTFDYGSVNLETATNATDVNLGPFVTQQITFGNTTFTTITFPEVHRGVVYERIVYLAITEYQVNGCRVILVPTDPNFQRTGRHGGGSWGQPEDDQWAIKRVGFTADDTSAWNEMPDDASPVVVAVIDTGLDWHHLDISAENIWQNEDEIPDNGIDDDNNGYIDDIIGWDFFGKHNRPWDFDGHGTVVAGIIAATQDNDVGIAGINPHAKIMVLKGVNNFGNTRASFLAEAIVYAADNGAQIINLSVGGPHTSRMEQAAINYAHEKGVLVVAASGNDGEELDDFGPGGNDNVLTVGATYFDDRAAAFSNYGDRVDIVAPGVDVLSLRARYTDTNFRPANADYVIGTNYVGDDKRYIHVSGTSFSTPIVAATASMLMSKDPTLTAADVKRILLETADDIEFPGKDQYTGYGMVNARAALSVDPDISIVADITGVELVQTEDDELIRVVGTIDAAKMKRAWMQIGAGDNPGGWKYVGQKRKYPIRDGTLGIIPVSEFSGAELWQVVINVEDRNGIVRRDAFPVRIN